MKVQLDERASSLSYKYTLTKCLNIDESTYTAKLGLRRCRGED